MDKWNVFDSGFCGFTLSFSIYEYGIGINIISIYFIWIQPIWLIIGILRFTKKNIFCLISSSQNTNVYKSFCRFFFNIQHHGSDYAIPIQTTNTRWWYGNIEHRGNYIKIDVHCVTLRRKNSDKTRQIRFIIILSNNQKLKSFQDSMIDKNVAQVQWVMP